MPALSTFDQAMAEVKKLSGVVAPFLSPEQIASLRDGLQVLAEASGDNKRQYSESAAATTLAKGKIGEQRTRQAESATDALIARGLFRSSIRQRELNDIDQAALERTTSLDTALGTLASRGVDLEAKLNTRQTNLIQDAASAAVRNAQSVEPTIAPPSVPLAEQLAQALGGEAPPAWIGGTNKVAAPVATPTLATPKPKITAVKPQVVSQTAQVDYTDRAGVDSKGNKGIWRTHTDGRRVFVRK